MILLRGARRGHERNPRQRIALIDHYRRSGREARLFPIEATEDSAAYEAGVRGEICACIRSRLPALKPEYAAMIERVATLLRLAPA